MYVNSYILISAAGLSVFRPQKNGNKLTVLLPCFLLISFHAMASQASPARSGYMPEDRTLSPFIVLTAVVYI